MALNGIRAIALNGIKWHAPLRGGVSFSIPTVEGAHLAFLGIVFNTYGYGERRTENGERKAKSGKLKTESGKRKTEIWRRAGIVFDTRGYGGVFPLGWVSFSIPMRAEEISSTGGISLCVSGIVFDTRACVGLPLPTLYVVGIVFDTRACVGGVYVCGWGKGCRQNKPSAEKSSAEGEKQLLTLRF